MHGARQSKAIARAAAACRRAALRSMPSTITAFMPKVRAPSRRGSARYCASTSPTAWPAHAGRRVDVGDRAAGAGLDELQPHRPFGACRRRSRRGGPRRARRGRRAPGWAESAPSSPRAAPAQRQAAVDLGERGRRRDEQRKAVLERVLGLERRRSSAVRRGAACSGSKRARRSGRPRKSLNHCAQSAPMSKAATVSSQTSHRASAPRPGRGRRAAPACPARAGSSRCACSVGWISAMRGSSRCVTNSPAASTTIQARSRSKPVSISSASSSAMPAQDLTG